MHRTLLISLTLLGACARPVPVVDEESAPPLPEASYFAAARSGSSVYRIVPEESLVLVHVGRAGAMQRLGHEHAVASEDIRGFVEINADPAASRADVAFPVRNLVVDAGRYRDRLELDSEPSPEDIAGTYANMLRLLEPALYPWVEMQARSASTDGGRQTLSVSVTLHGTAFDYLLPVELRVDGERLEVSGATSIRHSDFGIEPFAAAGGLLRVADELAIQFHLVGVALAPTTAGRPRIPPRGRGTPITAARDAGQAGTSDQ